ncbi:MAG: CPBP family intramembrane metalloprotease [Candidatus Hydrogenedentes bacterium]|nr:CPBP family intramembrane metalloprotease [Candidatus Hydrogenedentota bacterium]
MLKLSPDPIWQELGRSGMMAAVHPREGHPLRETNPLKLVYIAVAAFFALWTVWVLVLLQWPGAFSGDALPQTFLRAGVRIVLWLGPLAVYAAMVERQGFGGLFGFEEQWRRGLWGALALTVLCGVLALARHYLLGAAVEDPRTWSASTWINPILLAPIMEELLFRGFLYRKMAPDTGPWPALIVSSFLFALIHVPYWVLSGNLSGMPLLGEFVTIFLIGAILAVSLRVSGSVLTPIGGHLANNFFSGWAP